MISSNSDILQQLDNLLCKGNQAWLFGAGISVDSNIPLMVPLTERVFARAKKENKTDHVVLTHIMSELIADAHIEHVLSQLGDRRAIAERSKDQTVSFGKVTLSLIELDEFHQRLLRWISETVRWGYKTSRGDAKEEVGTRDEPIASVTHHQEFVSALFKKSQKGVEDRRGAVKFFTTNYDTLLEDALALEAIPYWDGFGGGAVGFRNFHYGDPEPTQGVRACVVKLHGSIDWHMCEKGCVWRVRDGDPYPSKTARVLIYPQATKYVATQRDPFASQFELLRRTLASKSENVFAICGYSFGDEHINQEIELAMEQPGNKTTILAFCSELNPTVTRWKSFRWSQQLYVLTPDGIYVGSDGPHFAPAEGKKRDWWTFQGVSRLVENGPEASL